MLQQGDAANIQQIGERSDHEEPEDQPIVLVLEYQCPICLEIEKNADNRGQQIGYDIGMVEFAEMLKKEEKHVIDKQPKGCVQYRGEYEPDELRGENPSHKLFEFLYHCKNQGRKDTQK